MDISAQLQKYNISPDPLKDQFFLNDKEVIQKTVGLADLNKKDTVLEIGAGVGNLTKEIAKKAGRVIAFEIDECFKPLLADLPKNVELHFKDAWDFVQLGGKYKHKKIYNKVVSNLPFSFCEQFFHNLTFLDYDKAILLVPRSFVAKLKTNGIFSSFFKPEVKLLLDKTKFYPVPKTNSALIELWHLPDPIKTHSLPLFLRQYIYQHESQQVRNSLREGIIKYAALVYQKKITKNEARKIVRESGLPESLLNQTPNSSEIYHLITEKMINENYFLECR